MLLKSLVAKRLAIKSIWNSELLSNIWFAYLITGHSEDFQLFVHNLNTSHEGRPICIQSTWDLIEMQLIVRVFKNIEGVCIGSWTRCQLRYYKCSASWKNDAGLTNRNLEFQMTQLSGG